MKKNTCCIFVSVTDETGRASSLEISRDKIKVVGVLPHCSHIVPSSVEDAVALKNWLEDWIKKNSWHKKINILPLNMNYIQTLQEQNKNLAGKLASVLLEIDDFKTFLQTAEKFKGIESNGERKDWISTVDVINRIQEIKNLIWLRAE